MVRICLGLLFGMALVMTACAKTEPESVSSAKTEPAQADVSLDCPDEGPKLSETGICAGRAVHYLNFVDGDAPGLPDNCQWAVNETAMAGGDYLLYQAARCNGKTAKLEYSGGARFASLSLSWSAVANRSGGDEPVIKVTGSDPANPLANILFHALQAMDHPAAAANCSVRPAGLDGWPADALVVDVSAEEAAKAPTDEPRDACGPFGVNEGETAYWRVFQGFSWWFHFSQDAWQDIDPRTLTMIMPDGSGGWQVVEPDTAVSEPY